MVAELKKKYSKRVSFSLRHYPLSFHTEADEAAIAIECARDQGRVEAFHQHLFRNQKNQQIPDLKRYARLSKMPDPARFDACLDKRTYQKRVEADTKAGVDIGVSGTPGVVVGRVDYKKRTLTGVVLVGARDLAAYEIEIRKYLAR